MSFILFLLVVTLICSVLYLLYRIKLIIDKVDKSISGVSEDFIEDFNESWLENE